MTDHAFEEADEIDEAESFIGYVYLMEGCRESYDNLCDMELDRFLSLHQFLAMKAARDEEVHYNYLRDTRQI